MRKTFTAELICLTAVTLLAGCGKTTASSDIGIIEEAQEAPEDTASSSDDKKVGSLEKKPVKKKRKKSQKESSKEDNTDERKTAYVQFSRNGLRYINIKKTDYSHRHEDQGSYLSTIHKDKTDEKTRKIYPTALL